MDLLAAIKREERKLEKELGNLQHRLNGIRAAAKALGNTASREIAQVKKRLMSANTSKQPLRFLPLNSLMPS